MYIILRRSGPNLEIKSSLSKTLNNGPKEMDKNPKIGIILTSTIKPNSKMIMLQNKVEERLNIYLESFNQWFEDNNFYIVIVENSGYPLNLNFKNKEKHELVSFTYNDLSSEDKYYLENTSNKGAHEMYCINYAINNSKIIQNFKEDDFLIKVTGRYFLPDFKKIIDSLMDSNLEVITQSTKNKVSLNYANRCEIIGCRKYLTPYIFHFSKEDLRILAEIIYTDRIKKLKNIKKLPLLKIKPTKCGGLNQIVTIL